MNILYGQQETKEQKFTFKINQGGELSLKVSNGTEREVTIYFVNGKFDKVVHNIEGIWVDTRSYWYVMEAIGKQITILEDSFKNKQP